MFFFVYGSQYIKSSVPKSTCTESSLAYTWIIFNWYCTLCVQFLFHELYSDTCSSVSCKGCHCAHNATISFYCNVWEWLFGIFLSNKLFVFDIRYSRVIFCCLYLVSLKTRPVVELCVSSDSSWIYLFLLLFWLIVCCCCCYFWCQSVNLRWMCQHDGETVIKRVSVYTLYNMHGVFRFRAMRNTWAGFVCVCVCAPSACR